MRRSWCGAKVDGKKKSDEGAEEVEKRKDKKKSSL
jgi:hypothetical protein